MPSTASRVTRAPKSPMPGGRYMVVTQNGVSGLVVALPDAGNADRCSVVAGWVVSPRLVDGANATGWPPTSRSRRALLAPSYAFLMVATVPGSNAEGALPLFCDTKINGA